MKCFLTIFVFLATLFCPRAASAQTPDADLSANKTFDKDGLSFSYPANWDLTDQSTEQMQQLKLTLPGTSALIYVNSPRAAIYNLEQLIAARESITQTFIANVSKKFSTENGGKSLKQQETCSEIKDVKYPGTTISGTYLKQPSTAEIYSIFPEHRFINLTLIRNDADGVKSVPAWLLIGKTIKTLTPNAENIPFFSPKGVTSDSGGVLNGRAVSLPAPEMPIELIRNGTYGSVRVRVVINEDGKVVEATTPTGAPQLRFIAQRAAMRARFSPTYLCGERVKVTGIIEYNFIPR